MIISDVIERQIKGLWGTDFSDEENGVPVIKTNNMSYEGRIDFGEICYRNIDSESAQANYLHKGDLLVEKSGGTKTHTVGYVNHYDGDDDVFVCNNFILGLRPKKELVNYMYLFYQLRYMYGLGMFSDCYNKTTGIQNLQVKAYLEKSIIVPKMAEQDAIVKALDTIQRAIDLKRKQLNDLDELVKSKFQEMFGDVMENEKGWDLLPLCSIGKIARGVSKHRPRNAPELLGNYMPLIQTGDIANSGMYISSCSFGYSELGVAQSKIWHKGTLCITIAANIGKCAIMTFDACFPDSVVGFIADSSVAKVEYVYFYFLWIQQALEGDAMGVAQKNINLGVLNSMNIPVPPIELQDSFIEYVKKVNAANAIINQEITNLEELLESKMDEYFGEKDEP